MNPVWACWKHKSSRRVGGRVAHGAVLGSSSLELVQCSREGLHTRGILICNIMVRCLITNIAIVLYTSNTAQHDMDNDLGLHSS